MYKIISCLFSSLFLFLVLSLILGKFPKELQSQRNISQNSFFSFSLYIKVVLEGKKKSQSPLYSVCSLGSLFLVRAHADWKIVLDCQSWNLRRRRGLRWWTAPDRTSASAVRISHAARATSRFLEEEKGRKKERIAVSPKSISIYRT